MTLLQKQISLLRCHSSRLALYVGMTVGFVPLQINAQISNAPGNASIETVSIYSNDNLRLAQALRTTLNPPTNLKNIAPLRIDFKKSALGREMLSFADQHDVTITYDTSLESAGLFGRYEPATKTISLATTMTRTEEMICLAHELRHAWQDHAIGWTETCAAMITPQQRWAFRHMLEADAFAFSAYFLSTRMADIPAAEIDQGKYMKDQIAIAKILLAEKDSADGLTLAEYRKYALEEYLGKLGVYRDDHLSGNQSISEGLAIDIEDVGFLIESEQYAAAARKLAPIIAAFKNAPDSATLETLMRKFGGISLDPAAPTSLQDPAVTSRMLFEDYPFRSEPAPKNFSPLNKSEDELRAAFKKSAEQDDALKKQAFQYVEKLKRPAAAGS